MDDSHSSQSRSLNNGSGSQQQTNSSTPNDTKPDISQLSLNSMPNSFVGIMGMNPPSGRYMGYQPSTTMPMMFENQPFGNLQSPSMHSQSSLSPSSLVSSPPPNFLNMQSPSSTIGISSGLMQPCNNSDNQFMAAKHLCAICGDRASGKHYGVYSCEGCKGFFKRTVRKDLQYACRDEKSCLIDKRQRNRCQYCRYMKCLSSGMKREAVQEERQRARERNQAEAESTTCVGNDMPVEAILEAEVHLDQQLEASPDELSSLDCNQAADRLVYAMADWAKHMPHFLELNPDDQVTLLKTGWNELLISTMAFYSVSTLDEGVMTFVPGLKLSLDMAPEVGMADIFNRILCEIVSKIKEMSIDKTELGCMRAIVLFNPEAKGLVSPQPIESLREKVYVSLDDYCRQQAPEEPGRFAKLLLRLPALRSIGLKCSEALLFSKVADEGNSIESFLSDILDNPNA